MRSFKYTSFSRFTRKENIANTDLLEIVDMLENEQFDADLGGGVFKQRIAREGEGKSGSYRAIIFFKSKLLTFFVQGFAKSDKANISRKELVRLKKQAKTVLALTDSQIQMALDEGLFEEIKER